MPGGSSRYPLRPVTNEPTTLKSEIPHLARLAWPIMLTQLTMMSLGVVDLMMVGQVGVDAVAAVSLGNIAKFGTIMIAMGIVVGIDPFLAQAHGANDRRGLALGLQRGIILALISSLPVIVLWQFVDVFLIATGQDPQIALVAQQYVEVQTLSVPLFLVYSAQRQYLQGRGILRPALFVALAANVLNVALNRLFIFGGLGIPALGAVGSGIATSIVQASMPLMMYGLMRWQRLCEGAWEPWSRDALDPAELRKILVVGVPIGLHFAAEIWGFQIAGLWAGRLGKAELAANSIVLNLASISFMLPLGIGLGSVTRIGNLVGAGRSKDAQVSAWAALALGAGLMAMCALVFLVFRRPLAHAYSEDAVVIGLAASTLPVAAAFQLFDGLQVVASGVLRAIGRTKPTAIANLIGYYAIGLPLGYHLAFRRELGLEGLWWGVAAGVAAVAIVLVVWVAVRGPATARPIDAREA
jgi:MATE family multidrug resistance protein